MKTMFARLLSLMMVIIIISTLCLTTFATNNHFNRGYGSCSNHYRYSVNLVNGSGSEKITVVNTCSTPLDVYVGGVYYGRLPRKNSEVTVAYHFGGTKTVLVDPVYNGTHSFRIKTTGYSDTIRKVS